MFTLAAAHAADLGVLFVILALIAFGVAIWLCTRGMWIAALAAAVIGVLILYFTAV
jgi:hypothetical protein